MGETPKQRTDRALRHGCCECHHLRLAGLVIFLWYLLPLARLAAGHPRAAVIPRKLVGKGT